MSSADDRRLGALYGLAIGDALGMPTQESVAAAFAVLALHSDDPWQACLTAASLGGDSDTIAAMTGAIAGSCHGMDSWPQDAVDTVRKINNLDLEMFAGKLLALRAAHDSQCALSLSKGAREGV